MDPESGTGPCKLWDTDNLLHICFDNITEYDPDVVFDKNAFCSMFMKPAYIQVLLEKHCLKLE